MQGRLEDVDLAADVLCELDCFHKDSSSRTNGLLLRTMRNLPQIRKRSYIPHIHLMDT